MLTTKNIAWQTGTGNITITYNGSGDGSIVVTSSDNDLYEQRSQTITVTTTEGSPQQTKTLTIVQAAKQGIDISTAVVTAATQTYSGSALTPTPTVTLNGSTVPSTGYDVTYSNNTNAGTATITVIGKGDYTGTATGNFTINKANPTYTAPTARTNLTYSGGNQYLTTTGSTSDGTIKYSLDGTNWYTTRRQGQNAGSYTSYWKLEGDANHNNVASTSLTTSIAKASRTLSFSDVYNVVAPSGTITKTATPSAGSGDGAITYSISSTTYATINSSTGKVTAKTSDGSATVTATVAEGTNYLSASASYTLYVFNTIHNFDYTGTVQSLLLPPGTYKLETWGAQGGSNAAASSYGITSKAGGKGGYSTGQLTLAAERTIYAFVGGQGSSSGNGGWNGGGGGSGSSSYNSGDTNGVSRVGCGGGATDIALTTSSMSYSSYRTNRSSASLLSRMIIAGGGSGGAMCYKGVTTTTTKTVTFDSGSVTPKKLVGSITPTSGPYTESGHTFYQGVVQNLPFTVNNSYDVIVSGDNIYNVFFTKNSGSYNLGRHTGIITGNVNDIWLVARSENTPSLINYSFLEHTYGTYEINNGYRFDISACQIVIGGLSFKAGHTYTLSASGSGVSDYYFTNQHGSINEGTSVTPTSDTDYWIVLRTAGTSAITWSVTDTYTETVTTESNESQVGYVGGGTSGGGYSSTYQGKQNAAGSGGAFGTGANQTTTNYRYCSGAGGGGWYGGGGGSYSDSYMTYCKYSGGGSGFVNTAANAQYRPSGYTGLELDSGSTYDGSQTFIAPSGSNETGHSGNGYARITRLS